MRYYQPSTNSIKEVATERPFWTLEQMNRNLHPGDYWRFYKFGVHHHSAYLTTQGPADETHVWVDDYERLLLN